MPLPINVVSLPQNVSALPWTGERFLPGVEGQIEMEHLHRYIAAMQLCKGKAVLDIASGEGYGCYMLAQVAKSVVGVDIDPDSVKLATEKYGSDKISFKVGSCSAIPVPDHSLDVLISFETIEHIAEQEEFVQEVKRVLKKEGIFIVSTPDRVAATPLDSPPNPYHIRELYREEFYHLLKKYYKEVIFFGQRSITGSLLFPDGRTIYEATPENLFFATADKMHRIECVEFFPRAQNLIAIASDAKIEGFSSSIYEGIHGTLDILNMEYDLLSKQHAIDKESLEKITSEVNSLKLENHLTSEKNQLLTAQYAVLNDMFVLYNEIMEIQKSYLTLNLKLHQILSNGSVFGKKEVRLREQARAYSDCFEQYKEVDQKLNAVKQKIVLNEKKVSACISDDGIRAHVKLSETLLETENLSAKIRTLFRVNPGKYFLIRKTLRSMLCRLGLVS